jgi:hypothetical protein
VPPARPGLVVPHRREREALDLGEVSRVLERDVEASTARDDGFDVACGLRADLVDLEVVRVDRREARIGLCQTDISASAPPLRA